MNAKPTVPPDDWSSLEDGSFDVPAHEWSRSQAGTKPRIDAYARTDAASGLSLGSRASTLENRNQVAQFCCDACKGSGRFVRGFYNPIDYGPCNKCKGTGKLKTDPETRAKQKKARVDKKQAALRDYIAAHTKEYTWVTRNMGRFGFASSMMTALKQYGSWTEGQLASIAKCMARDEVRAQERVAARASAPAVNGAGLDKMLTAFGRAKASRLKHPKLRIGDLSFQPPGPTSSYKDGLFVKCDGAYVGRISGEGKWLPAPSRSTPDIDRRVLEACRDPLAAAILHGKQTGNCACCGLELTNDESVRLGIGPICREKWGL